MSLLALVAVTLAAQTSAVGQGGPLRKSDIVRLLSGSALSQAELAELVARQCLTFAPTDRDRSDFRRLGADRVVLAAVEACARRGTAPGRGTGTGARSAVRRPTLPQPSPGRSAFAAGGGQRGPAGGRVPRALVFEVRDSAGAPLAGQTVVFTGVNARVEPSSSRTDGAGAATTAVVLGERTGSATVLATVGAVEQQVAFYVTPGPAAQLVVSCGPLEVSGRFAVRPDSVLTLGVAARDAYANVAPLTGLRAAVADARIARVLRITQDSVSGAILLKPAGPGTTSLAVIANGLRRYLTVTVPPRAAPGAVDC